MKGRSEEAVPCLRKALELKPDDSTIRTHFAQALQRTGAHEEAFIHLKQVVEEAPESALAHRNFSSALYCAGNAEAAVASLHKALELDPNYLLAFSEMLGTSNYLPQDPEEYFARNVEFDRIFCVPLRNIEERHSNRPDPRRRLRVGYISADFNKHPVSQFIEPVFETYSHDEFEVFCYANQRVDDEVTERLRSLVDEWRFVPDLDDEQLNDAIKDDGIDILVDLSGHTNDSRLLVFARKPAPVQVSMIGFMQTTGLSAMDYRITDEVIDPIGIGDRFSTEKLVRLPAGAGPFKFPAKAPAVNELPALKNGYATFASFQNLAKVHAGVIETWANVLNALPDSKLILMTHSAKTAFDALVAHGIAAERIDIFERVPMMEYLALHHRVDLILDTFPFNGYTTNLLSGWMGVPFVTIKGTNSVGRVGECLLKRMGIPELLAADREDYVRKTAEVMSDLPRLAQWRAVLRPRLEAWAGDGSEFTRQLERAYRKMWRDWCEQQSAESSTPEEPVPALEAVA
jgi:predicted O-linked N-acetylglucosamine transferase (SPINDLY family)